MSGNADLPSVCSMTLEYRRYATLRWRSAVVLLHCTRPDAGPSTGLCVRLKLGE